MFYLSDQLTDAFAFVIDEDFDLGYWSLSSLKYVAHDI